MKIRRLALALTTALAGAPSLAAGSPFNFAHEWTFSHRGTTLSSAQGAEILAFDAANRRIWVVGTDAEAASPLGRSGIDILDFEGNLHSSIDLQSPLLGGVNSVAIANGRAAVAITAATKTNPGLVRFFDTTTLASLADVTVGANPDSLTWTPDGSRVLVANEGEPGAYNIGPAGDPVGSVSIIDTSSFGVGTAGFAGFDAATLRAAGVRIFGPNVSVAQDMEPEYIAISADGTTAVATLQENNAVAVIDIASSTVTSIKALGLKDHSLPGNGLDVSDRDGAGSNPLNGNIRNWNVKGMYLPDAIASFAQDGQQFYVTANEGDARADWPGFNEEIRVGAANIDPLLHAELVAAHGADYKTNNDKLNRLTVSLTGDTDGDGDLDQLLAFGGRSFSILDAAGNLVFDSGDQLEQIVKARFPALWDDGRSDNKGPEPESVVVGQLGATTLMFLGLERSNAVMVWDLSDRDNVTFIDMLFTAGDISPEGLGFFTDDGRGYLAVANEVSGTTSLYSVQPVPVPAAMWLFGSALAALGWKRRRA
jgi:DNA-binding beta-propeller fold protein YncE